jgi:hypothetical protein
LRIPNYFAILNIITDLKEKANNSILANFGKNNQMIEFTKFCDFVREDSHLKFINGLLRKTKIIAKLRILAKIPKMENLLILAILKTITLHYEFMISGTSRKQLMKSDIIANFSGNGKIADFAKFRDFYHEDYCEK